MASAFAGAGTVLGVLPEGIERRLRDQTTRSAVMDGSATLLSPFDPAAGFTTGAAMARNKLIYALSDVAVVVSSAAGEGGTWSGAVEALAGGWVPVLVRTDTSAPAGNAALVERGARPLPRAWDAEAATVADLLPRPSPQAPALAWPRSRPPMSSSFSWAMASDAHPDRRQVRNVPR